MQVNYVSSEERAKGVAARVEKETGRKAFLIQGVCQYTRYINRLDWLITCCRMLELKRTASELCKRLYPT